MPFPPLRQLATSAEYRQHFENIYCRQPITTFDGIEVRFRKSKFNHCFFESTNRDGIKDKFSPQRAERIDWIKATLIDRNADLYQGWDKLKKQHDNGRRVAVVMGNYVVVIAITGPKKADFTTAYLADSARSISLIRQSPKWA